ncbi:MAG: type IV toxin-antitoxin system AbiEi family antitoxin [Rickettsiales bacterium]|nr:type IV toxin-antitoxin system AbiEi family antitoxin [Rickettsiales bacterium]
MNVKHRIDDADDFLIRPEAYVSEIFGDAYVGGWSAAEHWGLVHDASRAIHVMTASPREDTEVEGIRFKVQAVPEKLFFGFARAGGDKRGWQVSDLEKTLVDCILYPAMAGGRAQVEEIIEEYSIHPERDLARLLKYSMKAGEARLGKAVDAILKGEE